MRNRISFSGSWKPVRFALAFALLLAVSSDYSFANTGFPNSKTSIFQKILVCPNATATYVRSILVTADDGVHVYSVWNVTIYNSDCSIGWSGTRYHSGSGNPLKRGMWETPPPAEPVVVELEDRIMRQSLADDFSEIVL